MHFLTCIRSLSFGRCSSWFAGHWAFIPSQDYDLLSNLFMIYKFKFNPPFVAAAVETGPEEQLVAAPSSMPLCLGAITAESAIERFIPRESSMFHFFLFISLSDFRVLFIQGLMFWIPKQRRTVPEPPASHPITQPAAMGVFVHASFRPRSIV